MFCMKRMEAHGSAGKIISHSGKSLKCFQGAECMKGEVVESRLKIILEKLPPYRRLIISSCGGLQPFGCNGGALQACFFVCFLAKKILAKIFQAENKSCQKKYFLKKKNLAEKKFLQK